MTTYECKIEGCTGIYKAKGYCRTHYQHWIELNNPKCSVDGCHKNVHAKQLCNTHYRRLQATGDPLKVKKPAQVKHLKCSVDGCEKQQYGNGLCNVHWQRKRNGLSMIGKLKPGQYGEEHHAWVGDKVNYTSAHDRLYRRKGKASDYKCKHCADGWAFDWALIKGKGYITDDKGRVYSSNPDDYFPLCRHHHKLYDMV